MLLSCIQMTSDMGWCEFAGRAASQLLAPYFHGDSVTLQACPFIYAGLARIRKEEAKTKVNE